MPHYTWEATLLYPVTVVRLIFIDSRIPLVDPGSE